MIHLDENAYLNGHFYPDGDHCSDLGLSGEFERPGVVQEDGGGGPLSVQVAGLVASGSCLSGELTESAFDNARPDPPPGDGDSHLVNARNSRADGGFGPGRSGLDSLSGAP